MALVRVRVHARIWGVGGRGRGRAVLGMLRRLRADRRWEGLLRWGWGSGGVLRLGVWLRLGVGWLGGCGGMGCGR
jgi:hypothetical protein